ncbi:hypothetical protein [Campylobacter sp. US33a]|uniref:SIMPL domain-containing protein n=1 Tax=Campylobacter sp. CCS1377 TaxID=3158229 RepID=A0AAU7E7Z3_9BACT|nr:hypothetical protein [Campylobacter sp. US33a]MCW1359760.1 hypothetical protein [Campylobacter jejuni]TEY04595.1 hypothetical protein ELQ16_00780 [Campylobacter sp. US33a]
MQNFFKGLGIGLLCLLFFVAGVIFNVQFLKTKDDKLILQRQIEVSNKLSPSTFKAILNLNASEILSQKSVLENEDKASISQTFKELLERAQKDKICVGGAYSIEPTFLYKEGLQIPKGQRLNASFECEFSKDKLEIYNAFINDVDKILQNNTLIRMSIPALQASFAKEELDKNQEVLYNEALKKALTYEKYYSTNLQKRCALQALNLNANTGLRPYAIKSAEVGNDNFGASLPLVKEEEQSLRVNLTFVCE